MLTAYCVFHFVSHLVYNLKYETSNSQNIYYIQLLLTNFAHQESHQGCEWLRDSSAHRIRNAHVPTIHTAPPGPRHVHIGPGTDHSLRWRWIAGVDRLSSRGSQARPGV